MLSNYSLNIALKMNQPYKRQSTSSSFSEPPDITEEPEGVKIPYLTYDEHLEKIISKGDTGLNRNHILIMALIFLVKFIAMLIQNNVGFIKMVPSFKCTNQTATFDCETEDFCNSNSQVQSYMIDWTSDYSIHNLITKYSLYCTSKIPIMAIGTSIKVGFLAYLLFCSHLLDTQGRLRSFKFAVVIQMLLVACILLCPGGTQNDMNTWKAGEAIEDASIYQYLMYILLALFSTVYHLTQYSGWIYFLEIMPERHHSVTIIVSNIGKACCIIFGSVFFLGISRQQGELFGLELGLLGVIFLLVIGRGLPESPKYFHMQGNYNKARESLGKLNTIFNSTTQTPSITFIEEHHKSSHPNQYSSDDEEVKPHAVFDRSNFLKALKEDSQFRLNFISIIVCNTGSSFILDLFYFMLPSLEGDIYLNAFMVGSFQIVAFAVSGVLIAKLGITRQLMACYAFPMVASIMHMGWSVMGGGEKSDMTEAISMSMILFGFCANYNSTLYAAYACSPAPLAPTFFVLVNFFKIIFVSITPIIAEATKEGAESQWFIMMFFAILSFTCTIFSSLIKVTKEQQS
ncbi:hypothetical protein FGO68_gene13925 [Halteria grandinella]|uniref:Uncharacterized protein n=1 Tax=Halteria grandinella TaxID=5974 RepID=A0A8J8NSC4_HALGN|nr:hypothetical protein FGO68_gene13925 [Halteria grandinella]